MNTADYVRNRDAGFKNLQDVGQKRKDNMVDFAKKLKPSNDETMYPQHRDALQKMANQVNDNLWYYVSTPDAMAEFENILGQIDNASDQFEGYYDVTFGNEDDKPGAGTWLGLQKRNSDSEFTYGDGIKDQRGYDSYREAFEGLQGQLDKDVEYNPGSGFTIGGDSLDDYIKGLDVDVFMPNLQKADMTTETAPAAESTPTGENGMIVPEEPAPNPWADAFD